MDSSLHWRQLGTGQRAVCGLCLGISLGHCVSALKDDEFWWVYNDLDEPQLFLELPQVVLENVCML